MRLSLLLALATALLGPSTAAQSPEPPVKYWIFLTADAPAPQHRATAPAPRTLAPRAVERRRVRGSAARPAHVDRPVAVPLDAFRALGVEPIVTSRWMRAVSAFLTPEQREAVLALPFVRDIRPVGRIAPERSQPASPVVIDYGPSQFQLDLINARAPIEAGYDGSGVIVGFLDTTFDFGHPAFAGTTLLGQMDFTGQAQSNTHGLSVSSVAVGFDEGELVGPGFGADVLAATTEYAPTETHQEEDFFVAGLEWMETEGADVVNISLGYSTFDEGEGDFTYEDLDGNTTVFTQAVDIAASLGIAVVTSAGNEGNNDWHFITAPADADSVIAVGAAAADSSRAGFSSFGPTFDGRTKPDVVALGVGVVVARPAGTYGTGNGTSFSAPIVAGVVAQILQANPALGPIEVRDLLRTTAHQAATPDNERGWGVVNAAQAVQQALALSTGDVPDALTHADLYPTVLARDRRSLTLSVAGIPPTEPTALHLYDVLGRRVAVLFEGRLGFGPVALPVPRLPAGVYFYRFTGGLDAGGRLVVQ